MSFSLITTTIGNVLSFSVGTALTWPSPELDKINATISITQTEGSWISSLLFLGAAFSPFLFGYLANTIGRKYALLLAALPIAISFPLMAFVKNLYFFYIGRFLGGLSTGGTFTIMPMYIGEIADSRSRGTLATLMNVFLCLGMLFSYCLGPYVNVLVFNLILSIFPLIFLPAFFLIAVETPRYLLTKNKATEAREILQKIRGSTINIDDELNSIELALKGEKIAGFKDLFGIPANRKGFIIVSGLIIIQQFSGINAILAFSLKIFKQAGTSLQPEICSILVGFVQLLSSFLCAILIDRLGRKILLYISFIGMVASELPMGIYSYMRDQQHKNLDSIAILPVICLIGFILLYNIGLGSLPWTIMSEIFPSSVKSVGSSLTSTLCWVIGFFIVQYFQTVMDAIGLGICFIIFAGCCAVANIFNYFCVIETKGKTLEEIQKHLTS